MPHRRTLAALAFTVSFVASCDQGPSRAEPDPAAAPAASSSSAAPPAPAAPDPPRAPDIIVDKANVSVGLDRVPADAPGLLDKIAVFLVGRPAVEGRAVDVVAMRNARPSAVAAAVAALRHAKASAAGVKTETRDGATQRIPLSFASAEQECTAIAWIARDDAIDVWRAGGGKAKRVVKGLAGPDMTLGTDAVRAQQAECEAGDLVVGADDAVTWGLLFDLAYESLHSRWSRAGAVRLVTNAVPGRKLALE